MFNIGANINVMEPLTANEIQRAREALVLHETMHHPCDSVLKAALQQNIFQNQHLNPRDVDNMRRLVPVCPACLASKMVIREVQHHPNIQTYNTAEWLYIDIVPMLNRGIGGKRYMVYCTEYRTEYVIIDGIMTKRTVDIYTVLKSIYLFYKSVNMLNKVYVFDHEQTLLALRPLLLQLGVQSKYTPAGMKNKRIERVVQDIQAKVKAARLQLEYILPDNIEEYEHKAAAMSHNSLPNANINNSSPTQMITGVRPTAPRYKLGTFVLAHCRTDKTPHHLPRADYAIYLFMMSIKDHCCYIPNKNVIVSRQKVVEVMTAPQIWNLKRVGPAPVGITTNEVERAVMDQTDMSASDTLADGNVLDNNPTLPTVSLHDMHIPTVNDNSILATPSSNIATESDSINDITLSTNAMNNNNISTPISHYNNTNPISSVNMQTENISRPMMASTPARTANSLNTHSNSTNNSISNSTSNSINNRNSNSTGN